MRFGAADLFESSPTWQSRHPKEGFLHWDILNDAPPKLSCSAVISLVGTVGDAKRTQVALAKAACEIGASLGVPVLVASSQAVYGVQAGSLSENSPCRPNSLYGEAKLAVEQSVADRDNVTCLRIGNVVGADMLIKNLRNGPVALDQFSDGSGPIRSMIGLRTLAGVFTGLLRLAERPKVINVAQPGLVSMQSLLEAAGADWYWKVAPETAVPKLELDVALLTSLVDVMPANSEDLIAQARACGVLR